MNNPVFKQAIGILAVSPAPLGVDEMRITSEGLKVKIIGITATANYSPFKFYFFIILDVGWGIFKN